MSMLGPSTRGEPVISRGTGHKAALPESMHGVNTVGRPFGSSIGADEIMPKPVHGRLAHPSTQECTILVGGWLSCPRKTVVDEEAWL